MVYNYTQIVQNPILITKSKKNKKLFQVRLVEVLKNEKYFLNLRFQTKK